MERKSNKFIGFAVAGFFTLSIASQIGTTYYETQQTEKHFNRLENRLTQSVAQSVAQDRTLLNHIKYKIEHVNEVSEEFRITEMLEDGFVRGEKLEGTGEGIYYHQDFFAEYVGKVNIGDEIIVTWPRSAYDDEDWNNVKSMTKVIATIE